MSTQRTFFEGRVVLLLGASLLLGSCGGDPGAEVDASTDAGCVDGALGCWCDEGACAGDLACEADGICRPEGPCVEHGCSPHQLCQEGASGVECVDEACEPGFDFTADGCVARQGASCEPGADDAIQTECGAIGRECEPTTNGALCGACLSGYVPQGSTCVPPPECSALDCASQNRTCSMAGAAVECGTCIPGYVELGAGCVSDTCLVCAGAHRLCDLSRPTPQCGGCEAGYSLDGLNECVLTTTCEELGCAAVARECETYPAPHCTETCVAGFTWDADLGACRAVVVCEDLVCQDGQTCVPAGLNEDARCQIGCSPGFGLDGLDGTTCYKCSNSVVCDQPLIETGRVLVHTAQDEATCFCEVYDGYFPNENGRAEACDKDHDGWVNDSAFGRIVNGTSFEKAASRCTVRTVDRVRLVNTFGESEPIDLASSLALYESRINDGATGAGEHGAYDLGGQRFEPAQLNSLTKACASGADFNDNDVPDTSESKDSDLGGRIDATANLSNVYDEYRRFTYFLELNDGYFTQEPDAQDPSVLVDTYVIRERERNAGPQGVPLVYPQEAGSGYWASCHRHADSLYDDAAQAEKSGFDFASFPATDTWEGMNHHSQFRCFETVALTDYEVDVRTHPHQVAIKYQDELPPTLVWNIDGATYDAPAWYLERCSLTGTWTNEPNAPGTNPDFPGLTCDLVPMTPELQAGVYLAAVPYSNANRGPDDYVRGCINECLEPGLGAAACENYTAEWSHAFVCDAGDATRFGDAVCGCAENYAGASCEIGCPGAQVHRDADYDTATRTGVWLCGDFAMSSGPSGTGGVLSGGGFELTGQVPIDTQHSAQSLGTETGFQILGHW